MTAPLHDDALVAALKVAREALRISYNVTTYPGDGTSQQNKAIAVIDAALAAHQAPAPADAGVGWRPIETAPKDGRVFLAWDGYSMWLCVKIDDNPVVAIGQGVLSIMKGEEAIHWQPLPAAPKETGHEG